MVVKAGNARGTSQLTKALLVATAGGAIVRTSSSHTGTNVGGAVGIVLAVLLVIGLVLVVVVFMKKKNIILISAKKPESPTVSFENPFYAREPQNNPEVNI